MIPGPVPGSWITALRSRRRQPELMEQPGLDPRRHRGALRGLERVNRISFTAGHLWPALGRLAERLAPRAPRVLDLACGGGDVAISLRRFAGRRRVRLEIEGCDLSDVALEHARARARARGVGVRFFELDARNGLPAGYDAIVTSLFLHHLDDAEAVDLLRRMAAAARHLVLSSDLVRSPLGYLLAYTGCRLLTRSRVVHHDGPASVAAAFTPAEARELTERAGLAGATVRTHWPQRWLLTWNRD